MVIGFFCELVDSGKLRSTYWQGGDATALTSATFNAPRSDQPMRYMFIVSGPENFAASGPPPAELFEVIGKLIAEETRSGRLESYGGLHPTSSGARMRIVKGKVVTTDGPFTEAKEVIGGFSIYNLASREEALAEARKFMELHRLHWPAWQGEVEIRQLFDAEDDVRAEQIEGSKAVER
jgi:hypothetical protein